MLTCQVKASPRAFSLSNSLADLGKAFLHNNMHLGNSPLTTELPRLMIEPINNHPETWLVEILWCDSSILTVLRTDWSINHNSCDWSILTLLCSDWLISPALVLSLLSLEFWEADLSNSSPQLKMILPRVWGIPLGVDLTAPSSPANPDNHIFYILYSIYNQIPEL